MRSLFVTVERSVVMVEKSVVMVEKSVRKVLS